MDNTDLLTTYVISRGLIEPGVDAREAILSSAELLPQAAGLWRDKKSVVEAVLKARIYAIERELVQNAMPAEVIILRQAMIEVAMIGEDLEAYAQEYERRKKAADAPAGGQGLSPPVGALAPDNEPVDNGGVESVM